jgi:hypothetical protein
VRSVEQVTDIRPYPRGSRVIHIGPPKTGTTAVQSSLFLKQSELAAYGVAYPGRRRHERAAVSAVAYEEIPAGLPADIEKHWRRLTREVRESTADRVVVSSETFSYAPDPRLPRIVDDLGGAGLQVVITMRALASVLPSWWQQSVQNFQVAGFEEWLETLFDPRADDPHIVMLWRRLRVDRLVQRWGALVGEENVTVIVLDPADRSMLLDTFEALLGLPTGFLVPAPDELNLSLPYPEVEMLRAFNRRFRAEGLDRALFVQAVRKRALQQVKVTGRPIMRPAPIVTPGWAVDRANAVASEMAAAIRSSDARVIGDLMHLIGPAPGDAADDVPTRVDVESAAEIAYAMFLGGRTHALAQRPGVGQRSVDAMPTSAIARALTGRIVGRLRPRRD